MKIFRKLVLFLATLPLVSLLSCTDEEGEGGKAKISGIVYKVLDDGNIAKNGDSYSFVRDTIAAPDIDVYVIYGGNQEDVYDDKTKTSHNGKFEFDYLREGDYSIYACNDDDTYVMKSVHCGKKGTTDVEPIYVFDGKNTGKAGIVGKVEILYSALDDYEPGVETRVHIRQLGQVGDKDVRSIDEDGLFSFSCLKPETKYVVWVASETRKNSLVVAVSDTVATGKAGEIVKSDVLKAKVY